MKCKGAAVGQTSPQPWQPSLWCHDIALEVLHIQCTLLMRHKSHGCYSIRTSLGMSLLQHRPWTFQPCVGVHNMLERISAQQRSTSCRIAKHVHQSLRHQPLTNSTTHTLVCNSTSCTLSQLSFIHCYATCQSLAILGTYHSSPQPAKAHMTMPPST